MENNKVDKIRVQQLKPPKMKDRPNRSRMVLNLKKTFGFMPEILIIDKVPNVSNQIIISAVIPDRILEKEKAAEAANSSTPEGVTENVSSSKKDVKNGNKKPNKRSTATKK